MPLILFAFLGLLGGPGVVPVLDPATATPLPDIGPWLIDTTGNPAHWLGHPFKGKELFEPINLVILDRFSPTAEVAVQKLLTACALGGYSVESGHSCGYRGLIDGVQYSQIPSEKDTALSDGEPFVTNNHGRILGPAPFQGHWMFTGGFSRESFSLFSSAHHQFVSFNVARDNFGTKLASTNLYRLVGGRSLGNVVNDGKATTADHDGRVLVLEAVR